MSAPSLRALAAAIALSWVGCASEPGPQATSDATFPDEAIATAVTEGGLRLSLRTSPSQPPPRGTCTVELVVTDAAGAPKDGLDVEVVPWMPAHGHGASVRPTIFPKGNGRYVATNVSFFMPGKWELRTTLSGDHAAPSVTVP